jgi:hypothetical protein
MFPLLLASMHMKQTLQTDYKAAVDSHIPRLHEYVRSYFLRPLRHVSDEPALHSYTNSFITGRRFHVWSRSNTSAVIVLDGGTDVRFFKQ